MDTQLYQKYLDEYVRQAVEAGGGQLSSIREHLHEMQVKGLLVRNKDIRRRALADARRAFDEHSHWPLEIILSHLGVEVRPRRS